MESKNHRSILEDNLNYPTLFYDLKLARTNNIGSVSFNFLKKKYGSSKEALKHLIAKEYFYGKQITIASDQEIINEIEQTKKINGYFISQEHPCYPRCLLKLEMNAPPILIARGNIELLTKDLVAIVGSRNASLNGKKLCKDLVDRIKSNYIIVSGMALGIDTVAHMNSLNTGTIAILHGGIDTIYPKENELLYQDIIKNGCVISTQPINFNGPIRRMFAARNKLMASMCKAIIIVEAEDNSGSLMTGEIALAMNKLLLIAPGHLYDPKYKGNIKLLSKGGKLLTFETNINDLVIKNTAFSDVNISTSYEPEISLQELNDKKFKQILNSLNLAPIRLETILENTENLTLNELYTFCIQMEILDFITINSDFTIQATNKAFEFLGNNNETTEY